MRGDYSAEVRRRFTNPAHAGDLAKGRVPDGVGEAEEAGSGYRVRVAAAVEGGLVRELRFRAFGCPHLIAAAEAACEGLEGRPADALRDFPVAGIMELLEVPVEKTGRILLVQDALAALADRLSGTNRTRD